ncbi:MAG: Mbeg1-like protein, partial [Eubacterium sp.]
MPNIIDYINKFGNFTFYQKPLNEIDALIFSQLAYVNYAAVAGGFESDSEIRLDEASDLFFSLIDENELEEEISIVYKACMLLKQCAKTKRFSGVSILRYVNNVNDKIDKQFSAVTFYLNERDALIAFRGTDTSVTGVKESAMLSYMFPVPAQIEGLYYFQEVAMLADRRITVCGHSKGGNLATFAAVSCSNSLKKEIANVYEFDAPGFPKEMINRYDYIEMKSKIHSYIPQRSIIGCMLYHNSDLKIVKSINENLKQHQVHSWEIEGDKFVFAPDTDEVSKFIDKYIKLFCEEIGLENIEEFFETIFDFIEDTGIRNYEDIKK